MSPCTVTQLQCSAATTLRICSKPQTAQSLDTVLHCSVQRQCRRHYGQSDYTQDLGTALFSVEGKTGSVRVPSGAARAVPEIPSEAESKGAGPGPSLERGQSLGGLWKIGSRAQSVAGSRRFSLQPSY